MEWTWLFIFVILLLIESLTFNLITVWFAVGAFGAFVATYFTGDLLLQFLVFTIVTSISLVLTRPLVRKLLKGRGHVKTNLDSVIGAIGIVETEIKPNALGRVSVLGKDWSAKSDKPLKAGSKVEILAIEGVKLIVRKKEED
jgi:membrane protein implicated in regulation of membrane protease activity